MLQCDEESNADDWDIEGDFSGRDFTERVEGHEGVC